MKSLIDIVSGIRFDEPLWMLLLPLAAAGSAVHRLFRKSGRPGMLFPSVADLRKSGFAASPFISRLPEWLRWMVIICIVLALSAPRAPFPASSRDTTGIDIMVALDVSESMREEDFGDKSRFEAARDAALKFIDYRPSDRIGLVVFSGGSFTRCPLTLDHEVLARLAGSLTPGFFDEPGTAVGTAVLTATNRLKTSASKEKVLVLITDGENNAGAVTPVTAARIAAQYGIRIYTVFAGKQARVFDAATSSSLSRKGREELTEIARVTGGRMFSSGDFFGLVKSFREIDRMEKTRMKSRMPGRTLEVYPSLLLAAIVLLVLEQTLSATRFLRIP